MMKINVIVTGRSYHLAQHIPAQLELPDDCPVAQAVSAVNSELPDGEQLPGSCLISVGNQHLGTIDQHTERTLKDGDELVLLAPVAGG